MSSVLRSCVVYKHFSLLVSGSRRYLMPVSHSERISKQMRRGFVEM